MDISIIVISYKEPLLQKTVTSLLENTRTDAEVISVINGDWLREDLLPDPRLKVVRLQTNIGARGAFNAGLERATGKYIMRSDAHCLYAEGFDKTLIENCEDNWLVVPRRYSLDEEAWDRYLPRPHRDYHYFSFPANGMMVPIEWHWMTKKREAVEIDDLMTHQGSCWMANRKYFLSHVGKLDDDPSRYGSDASDQLEIGLKYWLGGGAVKINKKTWYAHLSKRRRHYTSGLYEYVSKRNPEVLRGYKWATDHWIHNKEPGMIHPFSWLIEKFWPLPGWPENWKEIL